MKAVLSQTGFGGTAHLHGNIDNPPGGEDALPSWPPFPGRHGSRRASRSSRWSRPPPACATPFRKQSFPKLSKLPQDSLLYGSDFPTPVFELSADLKEAWRDFKAILKGDLSRIIIPQDNLLDLNYRELSTAFPGHPMFTNFRQLLWPNGLPVPSADDDDTDSEEG